MTCNVAFEKGFNMLRLNVEQLKKELRAYDAFRTVGKLRSAKNLLTASLPAAVGDLCEIGHVSNS